MKKSIFEMNFLELVEHFMDEYGLDEEHACDEARAILSDREGVRA